MKDKILTIDDIDLFVFDFDGVLTDNLVYTDQNGNEMVSCSRADGLAFDVLRKLKKPVYILSTEENTVVSARAKKLKIDSFQGISDKASVLRGICDENNIALQNVIFVGNDINDFDAMKMVGSPICPSDANKKIKDISTLILTSKGGHGVVRELAELLNSNKNK